MANCKVQFPINRDTVTAVYLAKYLRVDACTMLYLFDRFKEDAFYFFYMLAGKQVRFPDMNALIRAKASSADIYKKLTSSRGEQFSLLRDRDCYSYIGMRQSDDGEYITFEFTPTGEAVDE